MRRPLKAAKASHVVSDMSTVEFLHCIAPLPEGLAVPQSCAPTSHLSLGQSLEDAPVKLCARYAAALKLRVRQSG